MTFGKQISARLPHLLRGEVSVSPGSVPVSRHGLRVERDDHAKVLGHAVEEEAGHPHVVATGNTFGRADLPRLD